MTEVIVCPSCRGQKVILGLGMMEQDCIKCDGIGYCEIEKKPNKASPFHSMNNPEEELHIKRRGRPKRIKNND